MKIDYLLEQYFEGLTTADEEASLRCFFTSDDVPENLMMYKPLFVHFDNEIKRQKAVSANEDFPKYFNICKLGKRNLGSTSDVHNRFSKVPKNLILWLSGVAACAAIMIGSFLLSFQKNKCPGTGDYVIIDGRCYTDASTIRSATFRTLHEMAKDGDLLSDNAPSTVIDFVENQLKEFDFLLDE